MWWMMLNPAQSLCSKFTNWSTIPTNTRIKYFIFVTCLCDDKDNSKQFYLQRKATMNWDTKMKGKYETKTIWNDSRFFNGWTKDSSKNGWEFLFVVRMLLFSFGLLFLLLVQILHFRLSFDEQWSFYMQLQSHIWFSWIFSLCNRIQYLLFVRN